MDGASPELAGRLYLDGHVRVYHGHQTPMPKRYVRGRNCVCGGRPTIGSTTRGASVFSWSTPPAESRPDCRAAPGDCATLLKEVPRQPSEEELQADACRFSVVMLFDRKGYSPELFAELWGQRIAAQTYRKGTLESRPLGEFQDYEVSLPHGEQQNMKLAERRLAGKQAVAAGSSPLKLQRHQTAVISTDYQSGLVPIARQISRVGTGKWFKYMIEHFWFGGLMTIIGARFPRPRGWSIRPRALWWPRSKARRRN